MSFKLQQNSSTISEYFTIFLLPSSDLQLMQLKFTATLKLHLNQSKAI